MSDSKPTSELHLRVTGQPTDWKLLLYGEPLTQDAVLSWMQEGMVAPLLVAEQGSNETHTLLVNFSLIISARILPAGRGD